MSKKKVDLVDLYSLKFKAVLSALRQEHVSFWFLCSYFFFEYVRPQSLYPVIDVLPWAWTFLMLAGGAAALDKSATWVSSPMNKLFGLFLLTVVLSSLFSNYPEESWKYKDTILGWLFVYFLMISIVNTEKRLILFMLAYLLFSFKMAQHGAIGWIGRGFSFTSWGLIGAPGWFKNSGEYAIQMLIYGSLALAVVVSLKSYWGVYKRWFFYAAAIAGYLAVIGASSRGSQLALAVMAIWMVLKHKSGIKGLMILATCAFLLYSLLPEEQKERFEAMGEDETSMQRLVYWDIAVDLIKESPVLGIGYKNWMPQVSAMYPEGVGPLETVQMSHNIFLEAGSELGFAGLLIFLSMCIYGFVINAQTRKLTSEGKNPLLYNLSFGLDLGMIGFLIAGSFVTVLYYPFFWIQIAMIVTLHRVSKIAKQSQVLTSDTELKIADGAVGKSKFSVGGVSEEVVNDFLVSNDGELDDRLAVLEKRVVQLDEQLKENKMRVKKIILKVKDD